MTWTIANNHWAMKTRMASNYLILSCLLQGFWLNMMSGFNVASNIYVININISTIRMMKWELWSIIFLLTAAISAFLHFKGYRSTKAGKYMLTASSMLIFSCYASYMFYPPINIEATPLILTNTLIALHCTLIRAFRSITFDTKANR